MITLAFGATGSRVGEVQTLLQGRGFSPGPADGQFGPQTESAVRAFQQSLGLAADGVVGPNTLAALKMPAVQSNVTADVIAPLFPQTPEVNIRMHLPFVLQSLAGAQLADQSMALMALGTIRAEVACFQPIDEFISRFNTTPGGLPFNRYDNRADLGNQGPPDGALFKGRGFVQLTGRANYTQFSAALGMGTQLVDEPDLAGDPAISARLLAAFLKSKEARIRQALQAGDLATARQLVNGGTHGLADFQDAYQRGLALVPANVQVQVA